MELKPRQRKMLMVLQVMQERPPTIRQLQNHVGLTSTSSVHRNLKRLETEGYITRTDGKLHLTEKGNGR